MHTIKVAGVNQALEEGLWWLHLTGVREASRNGAVLVSPVPVVTTYTHPEQRVLLFAQRDANPFFHLFEALWMLDGRDDVAFPATFAKQIREYSDDGTVLNGAYGYRWRTWFNHDQLDWIVAELIKDRHTRRCVLGMWDAEFDPEAVRAGSKDVPCNTHAYFDTHGGALNMTVCCRSNDMLWGAYGANAVHFSILLEYMAAHAGLPMGVYRQVSNNFHAYTDSPLMQTLYAHGRPCAFPHRQYPGTHPLFSMVHPNWDIDLDNFFDAWDAGALAEHRFMDPFWSGVAQPMALAHAAYKAGDSALALLCLTKCAAPDWRLAATEWIRRRN